MINKNSLTIILIYIMLCINCFAAEKLTLKEQLVPIFGRFDYNNKNGKGELAFVDEKFPYGLLTSDIRKYLFAVIKGSHRIYSLHHKQTALMMLGMVSINNPKIQDPQDVEFLMGNHIPRLAAAFANDDYKQYEYYMIEMFKGYGAFMGCILSRPQEQYLSINKNNISLKRFDHFAEYSVRITKIHLKLGFVNKIHAAFAAQANSWSKNGYYSKVINPYIKQGIDVEKYKYDPETKKIMTKWTKNDVALYELFIKQKRKNPMIKQVVKDYSGELDYLIKLVK